MQKIVRMWRTSIRYTRCASASQTMNFSITLDMNRSKSRSFVIWISRRYWSSALIAARATTICRRVIECLAKMMKATRVVALLRRVGLEACRQKRMWPAWIQKIKMKYIKHLCLFISLMTELRALWKKYLDKIRTTLIMKNKYHSSRRSNILKSKKSRNRLLHWLKSRFQMLKKMEKLLKRPKIQPWPKEKQTMKMSNNKIYQVKMQQQRMLQIKMKRPLRTAVPKSRSRSRASQHPLWFKALPKRPVSTQTSKRRTWRGSLLLRC